MYSKLSHIEAVLIKAQESLRDIGDRYRKALHLKKVPDELLVEIKDFLGNLRSVLDYSNQKIRKSDRYFPICTDEADFTKRYGGIDAGAKTVLAKWQPFNGNMWLKWFNILNNKNKHVRLIPQHKIERPQTKVSRGDSSVSWGTGVTFGNGVSVLGVPIDPVTQLPVPNSLVKTEQIIWVDFVFDNSESPIELPPNISTLPFLRECFEKVTAIIRDLDPLI